MNFDGIEILDDETIMSMYQDITDGSDGSIIGAYDCRGCCIEGSAHYGFFTDEYLPKQSWDRCHDFVRYHCSKFGQRVAAAGLAVSGNYNWGLRCYDHGGRAYW